MIVSWLQLLDFSAGNVIFKTLTKPGDNLCLDVVTDTLSLNVRADLVSGDVVVDALSGNLVDGRLTGCS